MSILVYPGTYPRFSTVQHGSAVDLNAGGSIDYTNRYVSIIGVNKETCIIKDDSGEYYTPPAEIRTNGIIKNLTFIATHDNPPLIPENARHKAYAVHSDYGPENVAYENCTMISYQAPAIGIGGAQNKTIIFKNCEFYSYAPAYNDINSPNDYQVNYSYLSNYGAFFYHTQPAENITGQKLIMDKCNVYSQNGDKSLWIDKGTVVSYGCEVTITNSVFDGAICGNAVDVDLELLTSNCYGNNVTSLNTQ